MAEGEEKQPGQLGLLASIFGALGTLGAGFVWVVNEWEKVERVLQSSVGIFIALFMMLVIGGTLVYVFVVLPTNRRMQAAEGVIKRLRDHDERRDLQDRERAAQYAEMDRQRAEQIAELREEVARLRAIIQFSGLEKSLTHLGTAEAQADTETN